MRSQAAFGDASGKFAPARAAAFVDALKPLLGVSGGPARSCWRRASSVTVVGAGDALRLGLAIDGAAFAAPAGGSPRLAFGGMFALDIGNAGTLRPNVDAFVGLTGAAAGRQAVHLTIGDAVRLFVRPQDGTDISLYPDPPGLGAVAGAALQALPFVLDKIAEASAPPLAATAGQIVGAVGDALDLRSGTPAKFDSAKLAAWAQDPAARFAAQLPALQQSALISLATAVAPALPAGVSVTAPANALKLLVGTARRHLRDGSVRRYHQPRCRWCAVRRNDAGNRRVRCRRAEKLCGNGWAGGDLRQRHRAAPAACVRRGHEP